MKTKKSGIVEELKVKYKERLARAQQELKEDKKAARRQCSYISDLLLFSKWAYRVGKGWYGFNLGHIPPVWTDMLNEFLSWLETQCPDFEIQQVKTKFGPLRIYIETHCNDKAVNERVHSEIWKLGKLLRNPPLTKSPVGTPRKKHKKTSRKQ
ncbi:MAG TPA: hypothetical protein VFC44_01220 [Candidatus Saccharimonadales bacterium]|nr:hypothetical protein [Candidatus Saccharimonadales bacterium]